jgi:hypothetical protein
MVPEEGAEIPILKPTSPPEYRTRLPGLAAKQTKSPGERGKIQMLELVLLAG